VTARAAANEVGLASSAGTHGAIRTGQCLTDELALLRAGWSSASVTDLQTQSLRRVLDGLYALVKVHFAKEEEVYLPLLDARLSAAEAHQMFEAMEAAAHEAKQRLA
jgi:hypothetical protein